MRSIRQNDGMGVMLNLFTNVCENVVFLNVNVVSNFFNAHI